MASSSKISEAEMLRKAAEYLEELEKDSGDVAVEDAVSSMEKVKEWWKDATGCAPTPAQTPNMRKWWGLLNDKDWKEAMLLFVSTKYGQKAWNVNLTDTLRNHEFWQFWLGKIDETQKFLETVFTETTKDLVHENDLKLIAALPFPRLAKDIQDWFFPKDPHFYVTNPRQKGYTEANPKAFEGFEKRRKMKLFKPGKTAFIFRREKFLERLSDKQFCEVYEALISPEAVALRVWSWSEMHHQVHNVAEKADKILHHVMFWYDKSYNKPKQIKNVKEAPTWLDTLTEKFRVEEAPTDDGEDSFRDSAIDFVEELLLMLSKELNAWGSAGFESMLEYHPFLPYPDWDNAKRAAVQREYVKLFDHPQWVSVFKLCKRHIPQQFDGVALDVKVSCDQGLLPRVAAEWNTVADYILGGTLWTEQQKKPLEVNGVQFSIVKLARITGLKFEYVRLKVELRRARNDPLPNDQEKLPPLKDQYEHCADDLRGCGYVLDPEDLDEEVIDFLHGHGQTSSSGKKNEEDVAWYLAIGQRGQRDRLDAEPTQEYSGKEKSGDGPADDGGRGDEGLGDGHSNDGQTGGEDEDSDDIVGPSPRASKKMKLNDSSERGRNSKGKGKGKA